MAVPDRPRQSRLPSVNFILLAGLLAVLWIAGGASRADAAGQLIVRIATWTAITVAILFGTRPEWRLARPALLILAGAILLVSLQLIPLPPVVWEALPGRARFAEIASLSGQVQPWRPWAIVPDAAGNALASLAVPFAVLMLVMGSSEAERAWLPDLLLLLAVASALLGALQFSGAGLNNPLVNFSPGEVSGTFANRNHFALFMAMGCLIVLAWAFKAGRPPRWRAPAALGLVLLFLLIILASGSRAGLFLVGIGLVTGLWIQNRNLRKLAARGPQWLFPVIIAGVVIMVLVLVALSVAADRAVAINRIFMMDPGQDMRRRALPTVLSMIGTYFPAGSGFGSFDPIFRIHEPFALLKPTFFNHAHNDFAEIALDGGLFGVLLLLGAITWWLFASLRVWRHPTDGANGMMARVGSAMLLLVLVASAVDYPARTPLMMALITVAAIWLGRTGGGRAATTLPRGDQHL